MPLPCGKQVPRRCPGLGDGVEGGEVVGVRGGGAPSSAHIEDPVHSGSPQTHPWGRKNPNFSPTFLGAIYHHLCAIHGVPPILSPCHNQHLGFTHVVCTTGMLKPALQQQGKIFCFNLIDPEKCELCDQIGGALVMRMTPSEDK